MDAVPAFFNILYRAGLGEVFPSKNNLKKFENLCHLFVFSASIY